MSTSLIVRPLGAAPITHVLQGDTIMIGRLPENDITIADPSVSRVHARLERSGGGYRISDAGSRNGVLVNEQRIAGPTELAPGDRIRLGDVEVELRASRAPQALFLGDSSFEMSPGATMVLSRAELPQDLRAALAGDLETAERGVPADPGKLLAFFEEVTHAVVEQRPFEEVLDEIVRHCLDIITAADRGCLILAANGELTPRVARHRDGRTVAMEISQSVVRRVADSRDSLLSFNAREDPRFSAAESVVLHGIFSIMCVPLVAGDELLGVLYVDTLSPLQRFTPAELRLFAAVGNIAAGHIMRQRLLAESIGRRVLEEELRAAAATQRRLLAVEPPEIPGYAFHLDYRSCLAVGGDYVDLLRCADKILLVLGDVCGKGIDAALLMATLQAGVHAQARAAAGVLEIVRRLNAYLYERTAMEKFATLFVGCLEPESGRLTYVNAGHDPPVIVRGGSRPIERLMSTGFMVGAFGDDVFRAEEAETTLAPGDLLVVFTDGMHEAESPDGECFGEDRLLRCIVEHRDRAVEELAAAAVAAVRSFVGGAEQQDDMTQLLVKRN